MNTATPNSPESHPDAQDMTPVAHTPGPWIIGAMPTRIISSATRNLVADVEFLIDGEANARLIASAPDLLVALEAEERHQWALRNREAISDPLDDRILGLKMEVERTATEAGNLRRAAIAKAKGGK